MLRTFVIFPSAYGATDIQELKVEAAAFVVITLRGIYRLDIVGKQYERLEGIERAEPNSGGGGGPTICLTPAADVWHYVFDDASGDCPGGCTEHAYKHFTVDEAGSVQSLGVPSASEVEQYASRAACR